jgi:uncharacterized protein YllA (UPF0747 family)
MTRFIEKIGPEAADGYSRLFLDFAADPRRGLPPFLGGVCGDRIVWSAAAGRADETRAAGDPGAWRAVLDDVVSLGERLGTRTDVLDKVRLAARGETLFVVTGQQPGVFGGPLLTAYKVFTAVALARKLEGVTSRAVVPLYWCGSDDTDFAEVRSFSLFTRESTLISASIPQQAHAVGLPAGGIATEWLSGMWENLKKFFEEFDGGSFAAQLVSDAFGRARDLGEHASAVLVGLAGGELAVIDGRSPAVRRHARGIIARYIAEEDAVKREVTEEGKRLVSAGYHAQLTVGEDSGIFLFENGVRKNVTPELRSALAEAAENAVEKCSPGVVARNLVQDGVFAPIAVVLGPAEVAYRCQMRAVYEHMGISPPVPVPRLMGTFLPPELAGLVADADGAAVESLLADPAAFARGVFERSIDKGLLRAARDFEKDIADAVERFSRSLEDGVPAKTAARIKAKLGDVRNRAGLSGASVAEAGKAAALERWGFLSDLGSVVKPGGKPQERTVSSLVPFLFCGAGMRAELAAAAGSYTDDLLDGRTRHIVYSCVK